MCRSNCICMHNTNLPAHKDGEEPVQQSLRPQLSHVCCTAPAHACGRISCGRGRLPPTQQGVPQTGMLQPAADPVSQPTPRQLPWW
mmetsp:Transcript_7860/g.23672  ORF Transcript_7860/g.23672 Transcript_7860/m.23672 type:complete len:86 (+) Transcript_7860:593-850(+)